MPGNVKEYTIKITGRIPSKKNSRIQFYNQSLRRTMNIPSNDYKKWHKEASTQILIQDMRRAMVRDIKSISLFFYFPDNRGCDLSNKCESIMDLLVDNKVIEDDKWQITGDVFLHSCGIDRKNPRCEIKIIQKTEGLLL